MTSEKKSRLLRIQSSLLKALAVEKERTTVGTFAYEQAEVRLNECLNKYKELVTGIDSEIYAELKSEIDNINGNHHFSIEEEVKLLEEIETHYNQLAAVQNKFKHTYNEYSNEPLELSNLDILNITELLKREKSLKEYLVTIKDIERCKNEIEGLNIKFYDEEKKENFMMDLIKQLDSELREKFNNSEGRIIDESGKLVYTSITSEYNNLGYTITLNSYEGKSLEEIEKEANEAKEKLAVATISYELAPSADNRTVLEAIKKETIKASYCLLLARIIKEIYTDSTSYAEAINKRQRINELLKNRNECIVNLGIKYGIDPFSRLAINLQLNKIESMNYNSETIDYLRKKIAHLNSTIESLEHSKEANPQLINEIPKREAESLPEETTLEEQSYQSNQVKKARNPQHGLNIRRSREKAHNVLQKVSELINKKEEPKQDVNPELTIKSVPKEPQELFNNMDNNPFASEKEEVVFEEVIPFTSNDNLFADAIPFADEEDDDIFEEMPPVKEDDIFEKMEPIKEDIFEEIGVSDKVEEPKASDTQVDDLFMDSEPFASPTIFNDRIDAEENLVMPSINDTSNEEDDFWNTLSSSSSNVRR